MSTQNQALVESDPLRDAGILRHVFMFLPGHWLILGAVCKEWQAVYAGMDEEELCCFDVYGGFVFWQTCYSKTTLYSAAVASSARARLACRCGLVCTQNNKSLQFIAGLHADIETLTILREGGMPLSNTVVEAVASSGHLDVLQPLLTEQQCPLPDAFGFYAGRSGSISMLNWLRAEGKYASDADMCAGAAAGGHLSALMHLRSAGCCWDNEDIANYAASSGSIEVVEWVRQQQGIEIDANVLKAAAEAGETAMCEHLRNTGCDWTADACTYAGAEGHLAPG